LNPSPKSFSKSLGLKTKAPHRKPPHTAKGKGKGMRKVMRNPMGQISKKKKKQAPSQCDPAQDEVVKKKESLFLKLRGAGGPKLGAGRSSRGEECECERGGEIQKACRAGLGERMCRRPHKPQRKGPGEM